MYVVSMWIDPQLFAALPSSPSLSDASFASMCFFPLIALSFIVGCLFVCFLIKNSNRVWQKFSFSVSFSRSPSRSLSSFLILSLLQTEPNRRMPCRGRTKSNYSLFSLAELTEHLAWIFLFCSLFDLIDCLTQSSISFFSFSYFSSWRSLFFPLR